MRTASSTTSSLEGSQEDAKKSGDRRGLRLRSVLVVSHNIWGPTPINWEHLMPLSTSIPHQQRAKQHNNPTGGGLTVSVVLVGTGAHTNAMAAISSRQTAAKLPAKAPSAEHVSSFENTPTLLAEPVSALSQKKALNLT